VIENNMKFWHYFLLAAATMMLIGFFFLPNAVANITDSGSLDNLLMIDSQSISFDSAPELSLPERITLAANPKTDILPVNTGNLMDADAAKERTNRELTRFFRGSLFQFDLNDYVEEESAAMLVINADVPTLNLIIWEFVLVDHSENKVTVTLDDETGLILRLIYRLGNKDDTLIDTEASGSSDDKFYSVTYDLVEMIKEYYGLPITLADYKFRGRIAFYRADIFSGGLAIPMYGALRETSFTVNERV
jgi:hypothetical protein